MGEESDRGNALPVIRLFVVSEGLTEVSFVRDILAAHLAGRVSARGINLQGNCTYGNVKRLIRSLLRDPGREVRVTTMIDLYQLHGEFPGWKACEGETNPQRRVEELERLFSEDLEDGRFIPYLQLHEFEALILTDANYLAQYYPRCRGDLAKLAKSIDKEFNSPEEVNRMTPPSRRIKMAVPEYQKVVFGNAAVNALGLDRIRPKCPHFDSWLRKLEGAL